MVGDVGAMVVDATPTLARHHRLGLIVQGQPELVPRGTFAVGRADVVDLQGVSNDTLTSRSGRT